MRVDEMDNGDYSLNSAPTMGAAGGHRPQALDEPSLGSAPTLVPGGGGSTQVEPILGRIDQYELIRKLGGGGFGVVYLARDTNSGVEVALKTLHPLLKSNAEEMDALREKFALVARLTHTNIAKALVLHPVQRVSITDESVRHELHLSPGDSVMVMDYAPGVTLSKWRQQFSDGKVPLPLAIEIGRQIASALDYAHGEKIVHRDIKPSNVVVETVSPQPHSTANSGLRVRILDFGLAAEIRSSMSRVSTEKGDTSGTRPYMAPEQWMGRKQDGRTDQYALACVLYELLSGAPPFAGVFETGDPAIMANAVENRLPEEIEGAPATVNRALIRALAKNPQGRFATCSAFTEALSGMVTISGLLDVFRRRPRTSFGVAVAAISILIAFAVNKHHPFETETSSSTSNDANSIVDGIDFKSQKEWKDIEEKARQGYIDQASQDATRDANRALLNDIRRKVHERIKLISKYEMYNDKVFTEMRTSIHDAVAKIDAMTDPGEIEKVKRLRTDIDDAVDWILHNGPARDGIAAQEEKLRSLDVELKRISADKFAASSYNMAKKEQKQAATYCDQGDYVKAASQYSKAESLYNKALLEAKAFHADQCVLQAEKFKENNLWDDCLKCVDEALSWNSGNAKALALKKEAGNYVGPVLDATWLPANSTGALFRDYKALRAIPMVAKLLDKNDQSAISDGILDFSRGQPGFIKDLHQDVSAILVAMLPGATPNKPSSISFISGSFDTSHIAAKLNSDSNYTVSVKDGQTIFASMVADKSSYTTFPLERLIVTSDSLDALFTGLNTMQKKVPALASDSMIARAVAKNFPLVFVANSLFFTNQGITTMPVVGGSLPAFCAFTLREKDAAHLLANLTGAFASEEEASQVATTLNGMKTLYAMLMAANPESAPLTKLLSAITVGSNGKNATAWATIDEAMFEPLLGIFDSNTETKGNEIPQQANAEGRPSKVPRRNLEAGAEETIDLGGGVKLEMVYCPGVAKDFWIGKYEVTQEQWKRVMGTDPSYFKGAKKPVESVTWNDCKEFVRRLNEMSSVRSSGLTFRLPTKEEWQTACRAGAPKSADYCKLADGTQITRWSLSRVARYRKGGDDGPSNVGSLEPNAWGLYDMHGNVCEWTGSFAFYPVYCGGGFNGGYAHCSVGWACAADGPYSSGSTLGLRLAATGRAAQ